MGIPIPSCRATIPGSLGLHPIESDTNAAPHCLQVQTIGFMAHLRHKGVYGPFLVVAPLSTLANWLNEFQRFLPSVPTILYHGSRDERRQLLTKCPAKGMC